LRFLGDIIGRWIRKLLSNLSLAAWLDQPSVAHARLATLCSPLKDFGLWKWQMRVMLCG